MYSLVSFGGKKCIDPEWLRKACLEADPQIPVEHWWGKVNRFDCKDGHLSGSGGVLMLRRDLLKLDLNTTHDLVMEDIAGRQVTFKALHVVETLCLTSSTLLGDDVVHFVKLADNRRRWRMTSVNQAFNLRVTPTGNYAAATATDAETPYTWEEVKSALWSLLPAADAGDAPALPATPEGAPDNFAYWGETAPDAIGHFLAKCGFSWIWDPFLDQHTFVRLGDTQAGLQQTFDKLDRDRRIWDVDPLDANLGTVPSAIAIYFRKTPGPRSYANSPYYVITISAPTPSQDGEEGTLIIHDDLLAEYQGRDLQNEGELTNRANALAVAFWRERREWYNQSLRRTYSGYVDDIIPGSQVQSVSWLDVGYGMQTIVELRPNSDPMADWPGNEHQPYREVEWVRIDDGETAPTGYYSGIVQRWNTVDEEWESLFLCWWKGANGEIPVETHRYMSTFAGSLVNGSDELRPVYVGGCCDGAEGDDGGGGGDEEAFVCPDPECEEDRPEPDPDPQGERVGTPCCAGSINQRLYVTLTTDPACDLDGVIIPVDYLGPYQWYGEAAVACGDAAFATATVECDAITGELAVTGIGLMRANLTPCAAANCLGCDPRCSNVYDCDPFSIVTVFCFTDAADCGCCDVPDTDITATVTE